MAVEAISRYREYDADSLRVYLLQMLDDDELLDRTWISAGDHDAASVLKLRQTLEVQAARSGFATLHAWRSKMTGQ